MTVDSLLILSNSNAFNVNSPVPEYRLNMLVPTEHPVALKRIHRLLFLRGNLSQKRHIIVIFHTRQHGIVNLAFRIGQRIDRFSQHLFQRGPGFPHLKVDALRSHLRQIFMADRMRADLHPVRLHLPQFICRHPVVVPNGPAYHKKRARHLLFQQNRVRIRIIIRIA